MHTRFHAMPFASIVFALAALGTAGCVVNEYHGQADDPHAGKLQHVTGNNYEIHPRANAGLCLDVRGDQAKAGQEVWLYNCHGKENQRWAFVDAPNNSSNIKGVGGLCLDVAGSNTADGTPTNLYTCGPSQPNQTFRHFENGQLREVQSGKCLTVGGIAEGQQLKIATCAEGNESQVWTMTQ
jgi:hypothetical protein